MESSALNPPIGFGYRLTIFLQADASVPISGTVSYIDPANESAIVWVPVHRQYWSFHYAPVNNQIADAAVYKYAVAEYPAELGFARQNKLVPGQWIEILLQQDTILY